MVWFFPCDKEQQCPLERGWQEMGPLWTAWAFVYEVVKPFQMPLVSLGLEGAQYHAGLNLDGTKRPFSSADASLAAPEVSSLQFRLN